MAKRDTRPPKKTTTTRVAAAPTVKVSADKPVSTSKGGKKGWLGVLVVLLFVGMLYIPSLNNDYVNWDDDPNITKNPNLEYIDAQSIRNIFDIEKGNVIGNYNPLPIYTFALEKLWSGRNVPGGKFDPHLSHRVNLALHLGVVFFVIRFSMALGMGLWGSLLVGLLFGMHPMRVESVAWATERKDVLFAFFYFAALWVYVLWLKTEKPTNKVVFYVVMLLLAVLSGLSKVQSVSLPLSMLAVDVWYRRKNFWRLIFEKTPFWLISLAVGLANLYTLKAVGSTEDNLTNYTFGDRLLVGTYSFFTYLYKLIVPYPMSPMYPYERKLPVMAYVSPLIFIGFWAIIWRLWKRSQQSDRSMATSKTVSVFNNDHIVWVFGALFFFLNVMFVLQVFGAGQGYLADRFTYVAYFGFFFALAYWFDKGLTYPRWKPISIGIAAVFILIYSIMTVKQIKIWENGGTLWSRVIELEGKTIALCWGNRAQYFREIGEYEKALTDYSTAIEISPDRSDHLNSRGKTYFDMAMSGKFKNRNQELMQKALADYQNALTKNIPKAKDKSEIQANYGAALAAIGQYETAIAQLTQAIATDPNNKNAYLNRSLAYFSTSQFDKAISDYSKILEIEPRNANIWYERGMCRNALGQAQQALSDLNQCISLDPNINVAYLERAKAKFQLGDKDGARQDALKAQSMKARLSDREKEIFGIQ